MKKNKFKLFVMFTFLITATFMLTGCGKKEVTGTFSSEVESFENYGITISTPNASIYSNQGGVIKVKQDSEVMVAVYSNRMGLDFSNFKLYVDNVSVTYTVDSGFSDTYSSSLYASYKFKAKKNFVVSASDVKVIESSIFYSTLNNTQENSDKVNYMSISTGDDVNAFTSLRSVTSSANSFVKKFPNSLILEDDNYRYLRIKVQNGVLAPKSMLEETFITITSNGQVIKELPFNLGYFVNDNYKIHLFDLGEDIKNYREYNVAFNLDSISFESYKLDVKNENTRVAKLVIGDGSYEQSSMLFNEERYISLEKLLTSDVDYSEAKLVSGSYELPIDNVTDTHIWFKVEKFKAPIAFGNKYEYIHEIYLKGLKYNNETVVTEIETTTNMIHANFIDGNGEYTYSFNDNNEMLSEKNKDLKLIWSLNSSTLNNNLIHVSPYDPFDYNLYIKNEKMFNLKELLQGKSGDFEQVINEKYTFKAYYNDEAKVYLNYELLFTTTEDVSFKFDDYKYLFKNVKIELQDESNIATNFKYKISDIVEEDADSTWKALTKTNSISETLHALQYVNISFISENYNFSIRLLPEETSFFGHGATLQEYGYNITGNYPIDNDFFTYTYVDGELINENITLTISIISN